MKKYVKLISLVLVVVLFATLASSCGISRIKNLISGFFETPIEELPLEERTKKVLEKVSQKTDETSSLDMELSMIFEGMAIDGSEFKFTVNGEEREVYNDYAKMNGCIERSYDIINEGKK